MPDRLRHVLRGGGGIQQSGMIELNSSGRRAPATIGYVTLGTRDLARGAKFYDAIAKELGVDRALTSLATIPPQGLEQAASRPCVRRVPRRV